MGPAFFHYSRAICFYSCLYNLLLFMPMHTSFIHLCPIYDFFGIGTTLNNFFQHFLTHFLTQFYKLFLCHLLSLQKILGIYHIKCSCQSRITIWPSSFTIHVNQTFHAEEVLCGFEVWRRRVWSGEYVWRCGSGGVCGRRKNAEETCTLMHLLHVQ